MGLPTKCLTAWEVSSFYFSVFLNLTHTRNQVVEIRTFEKLSKIPNRTELQHESIRHLQNRWLCVHLRRGTPLNYLTKLGIPHSHALSQVVKTRNIKCNQFGRSGVSHKVASCRRNVCQQDSIMQTKLTYHANETKSLPALREFASVPARSIGSYRLDEMSHETKTGENSP